jgi:hypothetical protein
MKELSNRLTGVLLIGFIVIMILLPVHAFFSTWLGTHIGPLLLWKSWKEVLLLLLVPLLICWGLLRPDIVKILWRRTINKLIALYIILHALLALFSQASMEAVLVGLLMNLRFLAMFILAQILVQSAPQAIKKIKQWVPLWLLWVAIGLSVLAILQVTLLPKDFLLTFGYDKDATIAPFILVDENPEALRAFATMRGPNTLGAFLLIPLAFALYFVIKRRQLWLSSSALVLGIIALLLTGSRSAWLGALCMVAVAGLLLLPRQQLWLWTRRMALPTLLLGGLLLWASVNIPALRLAIYHSSPNDPYLIEGSTEQHWIATLSGVQAIWQQPLGTGPGSAGPASFYNQLEPPVISENYFVQIGQEVGILGLALFALICVAVAKRLFANGEITSLLLLASFASLSFIGIFQHVWADDPTAMIWWGLAGLYIAERAKLNYNEHT